MAWPRRIYVATTALGVYYTDNFVDPGTQPVWTAVNTGLPATDCREFWLDPFDPAGRQYVQLANNRTLYRRDGGGSWAAILTPADVNTLLATTACTIGGFCTDPSIDGRLWAIVGAAGTAAPSLGWWAIYSDDHGDSWAATAKAYHSNWTYDIASIRAHGDNLYYSRQSGIGGNSHVGISANGGATWTYSTRNSPGSAYPICLNALTPTFVYTQAGTGLDLQKVTNAAVSTMLQDDLGPPRWDGMWFDPSDDQHQRLIRNSRVYVTNDAWANIGNGGVVSSAPIAFAPWSGADIDQMLVGLTLVGGTPPTQPHVIGVLYGEADTTVTGIAGANAGAAPYTDSIPYTCGVVAWMGIQAVDTIGTVHTYAVAMPDYTGSERGTPMEGDRGSWRTGVTHADDWASGDSHHAATTIGIDAGELLELVGQEIQFVEQAANTVFAGPAAGADADPTFRALDAADLPAHQHVEADITDLNHTDANAIHDNVAGEIHAIANKAAPDDADEIVVEDSGAAWAKKRVSLTSLLAGTGAVIPQFSQVVDVTVEDTTDEATLLGSGRGTKTLDAGILDQGSVIRITGHGYLSTTGTPTLVIAAKLGGDEVCGTGAQTLADTVSDVGFTFRIEITCRSTGATGAVVAGGTFEYDSGNQHKLLKTTTTTVDTTGMLAVDVTVDWSAASASNTITCQIATIELIKADDLAVAAPTDLTAVEV